MTTASDFDKKYDIIDVCTPRHTLMTGRYKKSFAYYTLRERLPITLTSIVDNLTKEKDLLSAEYGEECREEIKSIIGNISKLKYELQTDKKLEVFNGNEPDKDMWNTFIMNLKPEFASFFRTCWLYAECYMYRKLSSFFEASQTLQDYDYFANQKMNAMTICLDAMEAVALATRHIDKSADVFMHLLKLNLWGNRCDLSITSGKEVRLHGNPFEMVDGLNKMVLIDETSKIWNCISNSGTNNNNNTDANKPIYVDFVCDNAGYELFTDFIIADYIIDKQLAEKVRFHVKAIPWFISDVTPADFHWSLKYLRDSKLPTLNELGKKWTRYLANGQFVLEPIEYFWTSPYEYYKMRDVKPDLYKKLAESHLIIFKGDLNYRKLLGDFSWDFTEKFITCLRGFIPTNLCTLRTVKADLICGLRAGVIEELFRLNSDWMTTGEYGIIQYVDKIGCGCDSTKDDN